MPKPKTKRPRPTKAEVRRLIGEVVRVVNSGGAESGDLWHILTALRGPDSDELELKMRTTARIRGAIGLTSETFVVSAKPPEGLSPDTFTFGHFHHHHNSAIEALQRLGYIKESK